MTRNTEKINRQIPDMSSQEFLVYLLNWVFLLDKELVYQTHCASQRANAHESLDENNKFLKTEIYFSGATILQNMFYPLPMIH